MTVYSISNFLLLEYMMKEDPGRQWEVGVFKGAAAKYLWFGGTEHEPFDKVIECIQKVVSQFRETSTKMDIEISARRTNETCRYKLIVCAS